MEKIKLAIIYYSQTGHNFTMAKWAKEAAEDAGAEVRLLKVHEFLNTEDANPGWQKYLDESKDIPEASSEDLIWADAIIFSSPTRFGNIAGQMKMFIDGQGGLWAEGKLSDKVVTAMTSTNVVNGGQEMTVLANYISMMHWGCVIVSPGYTNDNLFKIGGNPYGVSATASRDGFGEDEEALKLSVMHQANRLLNVAKKLKY